MYEVHDNFLSEGDFEAVRQEWIGKPSTNYLWVARDEMFDWMIPIVSKAAQIMNNQDFGGVSYWSHNNTRPIDWHFDSDELTFDLTGVIKQPHFGIVLYLWAKNVYGGELKFRDEVKIKPIENRAVIWTGAEEHRVNRFTGNRYSLAFNIWDEQPEDTKGKYTKMAGMWMKTNLKGI